MARGDLHIFEEFAAQLGGENHVLEAGDTLKLALITDSGTIPIDAQAAPTWATYSAAQVAEFVGGYVTGGVDVVNTYSEAGGVGTLSATDIALTQNGAGFDDASYGILYNDTNATKMAIAWIDLDADVSQIAGPVNINWSGGKILTVTVTP